ncbi:MAG: UvrD-helicase domain-containing protein, partial [Acidobacteriota bacterium]
IEQLEKLLQKADADLAACLQAELKELVGEYEDLKRRSGKLDFVDLLIFVRNLLQGNQSVRNYFQNRFSHIFVDEFQDTDPLQAEVLLLLAADDPEETDWRKVRPVAGKLFLVGDPKQSIYRFRRADVLLYQQIRLNLQDRGVGLIRLGRSFRSMAPIQQLVNGAFASEMSGDAVSGQPSYVPLEHFRTASAEHPSVIALPVPCPYGWTRIARTAIESWLPDTAGAYVDWLVNQSGWKIHDPDQPGDPVPIAPRHICLLFRRFVSWGNDVTRDYTSALEARGIPHQLVGARSFHQREEVETLKAALMAIEWPDDELSVFATLKGTLFAVPDNLLLRFKLTHGKLHPFRPLPLDLDPDFEPLSEALGLLKKLHRQRNRRPVAHTVNALLEATRAHAGFALRPAGNQVLANVQRICDMARAFEVAGGLSFRGFVEQFKRAAESGDASEGPHLEEGAEGVRIMTVHAAKGLEFPVVLLADMTAHLARYQPDKTVDMGKGLCAIRLLGCSPWELLDNQELERQRDEAEGVRLAYVAATRARDILIVPVVGDEKLEGWLSPLSKAIYPSKENWRESSPAPGCPEFGEASVMQRPQAHDGRPEFSVKPGLHKPEQGRHQVVWWDPRLLKLGVEGNFGLRQEQILAEDKGGKASQEGMHRYLEWKRRRREAVEAGRRPKFEVFTASEVEEPPSWKFDIRLEMVQREEPRPSGKRFGTLVHTLLRDVDWKADEASIERLARLHARVLGADNREVRSAVRAVAGALAHPLMKKARSSLKSHRELPVLLDVEGNRILEGTIDLLFEEDGGWSVVDFKTDADLKVRQEHYEAQLAWYLEAVTKLTGKPVRGILLGI